MDSKNTPETLLKDEIKWKNFVMLWDEFLIAYSRLDSSTLSVTLFTIWHAVELYLKAVLLKINPKYPIHSGGWHNIFKFIEDIKKFEPTLLSKYDLQNNICEKYMNWWLMPLSEKGQLNYQNYITNQELYWISKYLVDIKYLWASHKKLPDTFSIFIRSCNPYWIEFFLELRSFLNWPDWWPDQVKDMADLWIFIHNDQQVFLESFR